MFDGKGGKDFIGDESIRTSGEKIGLKYTMEFWLQSKGYIKVHIDRKVSPNLTPILAP